VFKAALDGILGAASSQDENAGCRLPGAATRCIHLVRTWLDRAPKMQKDSNLGLGGVINIAGPS
jgi:hypothetical protein